MPSRPRAMLTTSLEDCATLVAGRCELRLAVEDVRSAGAERTTGRGFGLGFATALIPDTPSDGVATGASASGATTAGARAGVAGARASVAGAAARAACVAWTGWWAAAEAGRAKVATRPPEAARTADALT